MKKLFPNLHIIPIRGLRQRPKVISRDDASSSIDLDKLGFEKFDFEKSKPEEKFKDAFGHSDRSYDIDYKPSFEKSKTHSTLKDLTNSRLREFSEKLHFPKNSFTNRFQNQELVDFFNPKILNEQASETDITEENRNELLFNRYAPLHGMLYEEQLERKQQHALSIVENLESFLHCYHSHNKNRPEHKCKLNLIIPADRTTGYNNVTKLRMDPSMETPITFGYQLGKSEVIVSPNDLPSIKENHKSAIKHIENFLSLPCNNQFSYQVKEVWTEIIIRSNELNDLMLCLTIDARRIEKQYVKEAQRNLVQYFTNGPGKELDVASVILKQSYLDENKKAQFTTVYGKDYLTEFINEQSFIINPDTMFQTNTDGASELYSAIKHLAGIDKKSTILDLCCGSGATGLQLAPHFKHVIGIDTNPKYIENAVQNAECNKLENCTYLKGTIQEHLPKMQTDLSQCDNVIAIVNAPQFGINAGAIKFLRTCPFVTKIIYVSWRPSCALANMSLLLKSDIGRKDFEGLPFIPVRAIPIDMYPHTVYTQIVLLYERISNMKLFNGKALTKKERRNFLSEGHIS